MWVIGFAGFVFLVYVLLRFMKATRYMVRNQLRLGAYNEAQIRSSQSIEQTNERTLIALEHIRMFFQRLSPGHPFNWKPWTLFQPFFTEEEERYLFGEQKGEKL